LSVAHEDRAERAGGKLRSNLALRVASALVMAPLALVVAYLGGWPFAAFWGVAALAILWEWCGMVAALPWPRRAMWIVGGVAYAGLMLAATLVLRGDAVYGFAAFVFLFAVVWMTDIAGYFAGRAFGGPKLAPRVSPKKTWSGAIGGTLVAVLAALLVAMLAGVGTGAAIGALALVLSIASQAGDLLESAFKRRFDAKDASQLIPGHGGVMDRLDGFVTAVIAAALIGLMRGGFDAPARGLLVW